MDSGIEKELKFAGVDHDRLRDRLAELDAESQGGPAFEDNLIFDRDGRLAEAGSLLRVRVDARGCRLTFKGPATFEGGVKIRPELETAVDDDKEMRRILEALGYSVVTRYQKYRENWVLGSITISLDRLPIGEYAEFEGESCEVVARRCGLDPEEAESRNYLKIYADYRQENPDAPPEMIFT